MAFLSHHGHNVLEWSSKSCWGTLFVKSLMYFSCSPYFLLSLHSHKVRNALLIVADDL